MRYRAQGNRYFDYAQTDASLRNGLIGHWVGDGSGRTIRDRSGNNRHGTFTSSPIWTLGKVGQGLRFDGVDDSVATVATTVLSGATGLTVSAWFDYNEASIAPLVAQGSLDTIANIVFILRVNSTTSVTFGVSDGTALKSFVETVPSVATGWHHLVGTWQSGTEMKIYLDGILENTDSTSIPSSINTASKSIFLGSEGRLSNEGHYLTGLLDDARIYNHVLSDAQVKNLYKLGISGYLFSPIRRRLGTVSSASNIKTFNGLAYASTKTVNGLAIASVKTKNGLA